MFDKIILATGHGGRRRRNGSWRSWLRCLISGSLLLSLVAAASLITGGCGKETPPPVFPPATEEKMCHMFGVVKNKIMYGKKVKGIERSTFLIGPDGILQNEWRGLKVPGHVDEVLKAVKSIKALKKAA